MKTPPGARITSEERLGAGRVAREVIELRLGVVANRWQRHVNASGFRRKLVKFRVGCFVARREPASPLRISHQPIKMQLGLLAGHRRNIHSVSHWKPPSAARSPRRDCGPIRTCPAETPADLGGAAKTATQT